MLAHFIYGMILKVGTFTSIPTFKGVLRTALKETCCSFHINWRRSVSDSVGTALSFLLTVYFYIVLTLVISFFLRETVCYYVSYATILASTPWK